MWCSRVALLDLVKEMGSKSLTLYSLCTSCVNKIPLRYPGGRYSLWWPIRGGTARKGFLSQASRIWKCRDFTSWSMWKGREICHLSLWKGPKGLIDKFDGFIKSRKRSIFVTDSHIKGVQNSIQGMWKGYQLSIKGIQKGYLFREKWYIKDKGLDLGAEPPRLKICWVPPWVRYMVRERAIPNSVNTTLTELL